jgi:hypothetical protein
VIDDSLSQVAAIIRSLKKPADQHKFARRVYKFAESQVYEEE